MRVLVACEYSGRVRDAFIRKGHDAISCDLLPSESKLGKHWRCNVLDVLDEGFDLMIAHPPCTHLCGSGARWLTDHWVISKKHRGGRYWHDGTEKRAFQKEAVEFVERLWDAPIPKIAIENPVGMIPRLTSLGKASQTIQPWQFGHGETKATCLWLKELQLLTPTNIVEGREQKIASLTPSPDRWKLRSLTYQGIADAMAEQWG